MHNIVNLAKWRHSNGRPCPSRSSLYGGEIGGPFDDVRLSYAQTNDPRLSPGFSARRALRQNIRKLGTGLAEDFRVFAYAGGISDNLDVLDRDLRSLTAALDLIKRRFGGRGVAWGWRGFHVVLGSHEGSAWVNNPRFGWMLTLTTNFAVDEAALLIKQRFVS